MNLKYVKNGENITGITLHFADEDFDTGNIIMQKTLPLEHNETMGTLFNRTNFMIADCLIDVLKNYHINDFLITKQTAFYGGKTYATYYCSNVPRSK